MARPATNDSVHVFPATVAARHEVQIGFRTGGRVLARQVEVGARVTADQVLGTLDPADYELNRALAADQRQAADIERAQAERDATRFARLGAEGALGTAEHERQQARAEAAAAKVGEADHQLALAQRRASYATLRAPFAGVVTQVQFEPGLVVSEGMPVLTLANPAEAEVVADIPETLQASLPTLVATATPPASAAIHIPLRVREVSPVAQPQGRTVRVRFTPDLHALRPSDRAFLALGRSVDLQLAGGPGTAGTAMQLPAGALVQTSGLPFVFVVDPPGNLLREVPVQVLSYGPASVIVQGIGSDRRVVAAGVQKLHAGQQVLAVPRTGSGQDWASEDTAP